MLNDGAELAEYRAAGVARLEMPGVGFRLFEVPLALVVHSGST
jgi:hypothetical protein